MELQAGDIVGGVYKVDQPGPTGGMARVWRAWHRGLRTWHALKILDDRFVDDEDVRSRFLEEARLQARILHPNIARVTDIVYEGRRLVIVMDWAVGGDLEGWLEDNGPVAPQQATTWGLQILDALRTIHDENIVHRDIKPSNLLLSSDGRVLLTDFGVARIGDGRRTLSGTRIGTPDYMSPEQLRDAANVDARADLFAAGAVLYELMTGQIATRTPDLLLTTPVGIPPALVAALHTALQPEPADRFPDAAAFQHALQQGISGVGLVPVLPVEDADDITAEVEDEDEDGPRPSLGEVAGRGAAQTPRGGGWGRWLGGPLYLLLGASVAALGAWGYLGDDDGDGLGRMADACPADPEDVDGWEDADGCPDPDNDGDGLLDAEDGCPNAAEDRDGVLDADGCPDEDNDGDGVMDLVDACPEAPEDIDGFSDADGCPDDDNDGDHFPDASDRCPDVAESDDGFLDGDGCPDPAVAVGDLHSCALTYLGGVVCWGSDEGGRGGARPGGLVSLQAAGDHTCGLTLSGDILCWGVDTSGEAPAQVLGPFSGLAVGERHACAIAAGGKVRCWGAPDEVVRRLPAEGRFTMVTVGLEHACALNAGGEVTCWGASTLGAQDAPGGAFVDISAGAWHTCGVRRGGRVECWGFDGDGQASPPGDRFRMVRSGRWHSCGVRADGLLRCWGFNGEGQAPPALTGDFHQIAVGRAHGCGVRRSGEVACWGEDAQGQTSPPHSRGLLYPSP